jgi:hypothetical protein
MRGMFVNRDLDMTLPDDDRLPSESQTGSEISGGAKSRSSSIKCSEKSVSYRHDNENDAMVIYLIRRTEADNKKSMVSSDFDYC